MDISKKKEFTRYIDICWWEVLTLLRSTLWVPLKQVSLSLSSLSPTLVKLKLRQSSSTGVHCLFQKVSLFEALKQASSWSRWKQSGLKIR